MHWGNPPVLSRDSNLYYTLRRMALSPEFADFDTFLGSQRFRNLNARLDTE
jgi:hypothetical protein